MLRLPVAGFDVRLQLPTGAEDLLLLETAPDFAVAIALLERVVRRVDGEPLDGAALVITDVDVLLLWLRQRVLGDRLSAELRCETCGARVDLAFSIDAYVAHHRPTQAPSLGVGTIAGWYRIDGDGDVEFRLPCAADQLAIALEPEPEQALVRLCVRPAALPSSAQQRVEAAMEAIAPSLSSELAGICPECDAAVTAVFDPLQYTLHELRDQAAFVYEEVAAIAHHLHWSEAEILALPTVRRARYAELASAGRGSA